MGPFPASPGQNYDVLAAGFDMATKKHAMPWKAARESMMPEDKLLVPALRCEQKIMAEGPDGAFWTTGVWVVHAFLESIRDRGLTAAIAHHV